MTEDRYRQWKDDIAAARADGDTRRLYSLQLDYNLELGSCLAHQSQRTKDIKEELVSVKADITNVGTTVGTLAHRIGTLESAVEKTADNVSDLAKSVKDLVEYRHDREMKTAGVMAAGRNIRTLVCGIAIVVGWAYAIYEAWLHFSGK